MKLDLLLRLPVAAFTMPEPMALLDWGVRAEALGYETVWLAGGKSSPGSAYLLVLATALLARTRRLRVGVVIADGAGAATDQLRDAIALMRGLASDRLVVARSLGQAGAIKTVALSRPSEAGAAASAVAADLAGDVETVTRALWRLWQADSEVVLLLDFLEPVGSLAEAAPALETFAREILPRFGPQPLLPPSYA